MGISADHQGQQTPAESMGSMLEGSPASSVESAVRYGQPIESQAFSSPPTPSYSLNLQIDQLTLHGFSASDRHCIGAALQTELTRLFAEQGMLRSLQQGEVINQLDGGAFEMSAGTLPHVIGTRIARSIYQGLGYE